MSHSILLLAAAAVQADGTILVTGSREPVGADESPVSATVVDAERSRRWPCRPPPICCG